MFLGAVIVMAGEMGGEGVDKEGVVRVCCVILKWSLGFAP